MEMETEITQGAPVGDAQRVWSPSANQWGRLTDHCPTFELWVEFWAKLAFRPGSPEHARYMRHREAGVPRESESFWVAYDAARERLVQEAATAPTPAQQPDRGRGRGRRRR